jgi:hypothetical protein
MGYYQVSLRGRPVAFVKTIDMVQKIVRCRRHGYYSVEKLECGADFSSGAKGNPKNAAANGRLKSTSDLGKRSAYKAAGKVSRPKSKKPR